MGGTAIVDLTAVWGGVVVVLSSLAWVGQVASWLAPARAASIGLTEAESDVDPVFWADVRGEAKWDTFTLWTMVVAGVLMIAESTAWPYFGLVGGGMYAYFAGRGIVTRLEMRRRDFRIGSPGSVSVGLAALAIWGVMAGVTIVSATLSLRGS